MATEMPSLPMRNLAQCNAEIKEPFSSFSLYQSTVFVLHDVPPSIVGGWAGLGNQAASMLLARRASVLVESSNGERSNRDKSRD
jgi:hypothetical protein